MALVVSSPPLEFIPVPHVVYATVPANGYVTIPLVFNGVSVPVGVTTQVALVLNAVDVGAVLALLSPLCLGEGVTFTATLDLQELPLPEPAP
jgi:hypothetical protein